MTERFTCSIGIADGVERACVERFTPFEPPNLLDAVADLPVDNP
jgi:hypothetical protein